MSDWVTHAVQTLGVTGVALLMLLENIFPPIPSELIMPLAGFLSASGVVAFWPTVFAGAAGSLAGASLWYVVGRSVGERRLREWVDAHGRWLTVSAHDVDRAERWFRRHGGAAVFVGRLIPGVRTFISLPAGFARMPLVPFLLYSAAGTLVWSAFLAYAGRLLGERYERVGHYLAPVTTGVLVAAVLLYIWRVLRWQSTRGDGGPEGDVRT